MSKRPVPTALNLLRGNPGHRPINKDEPMPELGTEMPEGLSAEAQKHWLKISVQLENCGLLTQVDAQALELYCEAYARWKEARKKLSDKGMVDMTSKGYLIQSPYLSISNRAHDQMVALLKEFGMTPAARSKVTVAPKSPKENPFLALMKTIDHDE